MSSVNYTLSMSDLRRSERGFLILCAHCVFLLHCIDVVYMYAGLFGW